MFLALAAPCGTSSGRRAGVGSFWVPWRSRSSSRTSCRMRSSAWGSRRCSRGRAGNGSRRSAGRPVAPGGLWWIGLSPAGQGVGGRPRCGLPAPSLRRGDGARPPVDDRRLPGHDRRVALHRARCGRAPRGRPRARRSRPREAPARALVAIPIVCLVMFFSTGSMLGDVWLFSERFPVPGLMSLIPLAECRAGRGVVVASLALSVGASSIVNVCRHFVAFQLDEVGDIDGAIDAMEPEARRRAHLRQVVGNRERRAVPPLRVVLPGREGGSRPVLELGSPLLAGSISSQDTTRRPARVRGCAGSGRRRASDPGALSVLRLRARARLGVLASGGDVSRRVEGGWVDRVGAGRAVGGRALSGGSQCQYCSHLSHVGRDTRRPRHECRGRRPWESPPCRRASRATLSRHPLLPLFEGSGNTRLLLGSEITGRISLPQERNPLEPADRRACSRSPAPA